MQFGTITELGINLADLCYDLAEWSQATFGTDQERGPLGALRHLEKEAREAQEAWTPFGPADDAAREKFKGELADCLHLVLDAARRGGIKPMQLLIAAEEKLKVNRSRRWPKPTGDEPVEHIREAQ